MPRSVVFWLYASLYSQPLNTPKRIRTVVSGSKDLRDWPLHYRSVVRVQGVKPRFLGLFKYDFLLAIFRSKPRVLFVRRHAHMGCIRFELMFYRSKRQVIPSYTNNPFMGYTGFEPVSPGLEPRMLPDCTSTPMRSAGFEPTPPGWKPDVQYQITLWTHYGNDKNRTCYLLLNRQARIPLSFIPKYSMRDSNPRVKSYDTGYLKSLFEFGSFKYGPQEQESFLSPARSTRLRHTPM